MMRKFFSGVLLMVGIVIGLGAVGHTLAGSQVHAALDKFPIDPNVGTMIYVVWYFVSCCMFFFGLTIIWIWYQLRSGDAEPLIVAVLIGVLYLGNGIGGMIYRHGDPFMGFFIVLGGLLLICSFVLRSGLPD